MGLRHGTCFQGGKLSRTLHLHSPLVLGFSISRIAASFQLARTSMITIFKLANFHFLSFFFFFLTKHGYLQSFFENSSSQRAMTCRHHCLYTRSRCFQLKRLSPSLAPIGKSFTFPCISSVHVASRLSRLGPAMRLGRANVSVIRTIAETWFLRNSYIAARYHALRMSSSRVYQVCSFAPVYGKS